MRFTESVAVTVVAAVATFAGASTAAVALPPPALALSPAARQATLAFVHTSCASANTSCTQSLETSAEDGTNVRTVTTFPAGGASGAAGPPEWSPDRAWLAYGVTANGSTALFLSSADGSSTTQLTPSVPGDMSFSWAPDSRQLAFVQGGAVEVVAIDGSGSRTVVANTPFDAVDWSPTGDLLALGDGASLAVMAPDGTGLRTVASAAELAADVGACPSSGIPPEVGAPVWSPDGRWLAFVGLLCQQLDAGPLVAEPAALFVPGGGLLTSPLLTFAVPDPTWDPDGGGYAVTVPDGVDLVRLHGTVTHVPASNGLVYPAAWTPDGRALVVSEVTPSSSPGGQLHLLSADGSGSDMALPLTNVDLWPSVSSSPATVRTQGVLRTDTADEIARAVWPTPDWTANRAVVIARDDNYADGLSGGPLAASVGGPLLLTEPDSLPPAVCDELTRLAPITAYLMGDTTAISDGVAAQVRICAGGSTIRRVEGPTRYDTAAASAQLVGGNDVFVTEGIDPDPTRGWPDAVAVSGLAAYQRRPILLTEHDALPPGTVAALRALDATHATIVGGADVVSDEVAGKLESMGITVERIAGPDRYGTSAAIAAVEVSAGMSAAAPWLVVGNNWPDALSAGPAAGHVGSALVLVDGASLANSPATEAWLTSVAPSSTQIRLIGGPDVLSPAVEVQSINLASG